MRVDASTSPSLNAAYPSEYTAQLSPRTRALLRAANHSGRMWNPYAAGLRAQTPRASGYGSVARGPLL